MGLTDDKIVYTTTVEHLTVVCPAFGELLSNKIIETTAISLTYDRVLYPGLAEPALAMPEVRQRAKAVTRNAPFDVPDGRMENRMGKYS